MTASAGEILQYKLKVLAYIPIGIDLFNETAQDIARLCSCDDCGIEERCGFLENILGLLKDKGADEERIEAAKPVFEAIQDGILLERIARRLKNLEEVKSAILTIINTARDSVPELQKKFLEADANFESLLCSRDYTENGAGEQSGNVGFGVTTVHNRENPSDASAQEEMQPFCVMEDLAPKDEKATVASRYVRTERVGCTGSIPEATTRPETPRASVLSNTEQGSSKMSAHASVKPRLKPELGRPGLRRPSANQIRVTSSVTAPSVQTSPKILSETSPSVSNASTSEININGESNDEPSIAIRNQELKSQPDLLAESADKMRSIPRNHTQTHGNETKYSSSESAVLSNASGVKTMAPTATLESSHLEGAKTPQHSQSCSDGVTNSKASQGVGSAPTNGDSNGHINSHHGPSASSKTGELGDISAPRARRGPPLQSPPNETTQMQTFPVSGNTITRSDQERSTRKPKDRICTPLGSNASPESAITSVTSSQDKSIALDGPFHHSTAVIPYEKIAEECHRSTPKAVSMAGHNPPESPVKEHKILGRVKREADETNRTFPSLASFPPLPPRASASAAAAAASQNVFVPNEDLTCYFWYHGNRCNKAANVCRFRHAQTEWIASPGPGPPEFIGKTDESRGLRIGRTPIVDRLWGLHAVYSSDRHPFVDAIIENISRRSPSLLDFITDCRDQYGRPCSLSLSNGSMRSQLMGCFGMEGFSSLRAKLELKLGIFVAANPDKFPDLDPSAYAKYGIRLRRK